MHVHPPQWGACRSGPGLGGAQVDAIMKGSASGTAKHNVITEYMLTLLGLTYAADTQAPSPSPAPAAHRPTRPRRSPGRGGPRTPACAGVDAVSPSRAGRARPHESLFPFAR